MLIHMIQCYSYTHIQAFGIFNTGLLVFDIFIIPKPNALP